MPAYKKETEQYHIERVREVLALKPRAGAIAISRFLREDPHNPINLDPHYILKLKKKIEGERVHRFDHAKVEAHIAEMQDEIDQLCVEMWTIVLNRAMDERARVAAAKIIIDAKIKLFEAKLDAGIFERKLGTFDIKNTYEIKNEHKVLILNALANYGIIAAEQKKENESTAINN
ncbi:MAG: hypothetical protein KatS3mg101_1084 [Patescibacteria group bacterium]|nr:MAG: hypothetical protein KatS3mg101_1084 [Patescibacteria group bacterium]